MIPPTSIPPVFKDAMTSEIFSSFINTIATRFLEYDITPISSSSSSFPYLSSHRPLHSLHYLLLSLLSPCLFPLHSRTLISTLRSNEGGLAMEVLSCLSKVGRFDMLLMFASSQEKQRMSPSLPPPLPLSPSPPFPLLLSSFLSKEWGERAERWEEGGRKRR